MTSWTASLYRETRSFLSPLSFLSYRQLVMREPQSPTGELLRLRMKAPVRRPVYLRKWGSDPATFEEVFVEQVYRPVVEHLHSCRTLIDLGANIGLASLYLSSRFQCRAVCVEPNPDTFRILQKNFSGTGALLLNAAVWSEPANLRAECQNARFSMSRVTPDSGGDIPGLTIGEIIRKSGFDTVDLLKVDIEGAEVELFRGDSSWLETVGALAIEFHADSRKMTDFDAVMERFGFRIVEAGHTVLALRRH